MKANTRSRWNLFRRHAPGSIVEQSGPGPPPKTDTKSKTWVTTIHPVTSGLEEAKLLKEHTWLSYVYGVGDIILLLCPIYFILLGIAVVTLNGKPTKGSEFGTKVEVAINLGPTIFPIVFAAISGRSMKMIARYLAEKGTKISTLELLMASQSVWGTVESQLAMQRLTLVGVNLLFLWALSPIGGQASLRLMERHDRDISSDTKLRYMTTGPGGTTWGLATTYVGSGKFADAGALYTAALLAPLAIKTGPRDPWGNVKIPNMEYLDSNKTDAEGLPLVGLPSTDRSNFTVESTYLTVDCGRFNQTPYPGINSTNNGRTDIAKLEDLVPGYIWTNKSSNNPFEPSEGRTASFFIDTNLGSAWDPEDPMYETLLGRLDGFFGHINQSRLSNDQSKVERELIYTSMYATSAENSEFGLNIARCALAQKHVEAMIECVGGQCATTKVRTSLIDTRPSALTAFEHGLIMQNFAEQFPIAVSFSVGSSPTELFLANTSAFPFIQQTGQITQDIAYTNLSLIEPAVFSRRLSSVLNTYYQLTIQPTGYFGSLSQNLSLYGPDTLPVTDINKYLPSNFSATNNSFFDWWPIFEARVQQSDSPFIGATTMAKVTMTDEIFASNTAWLSLLMACSTIIFITGAGALFLKQQTLGPEMFGFVSSMTYENPWVRIPGGETMLEATERARLLQDVEVHVGDVRGDQDIGHIALATGVPLRKLEQGRLYA